MEHPAYSPDLVPCAFFPRFSYMKKQLKGRGSAEDGGLFSVLSELMSDIPPDMVLRVLGHWNRRLRLCLLMEEEYVM
jgi:hypothetical protein